jgi:hypothetical protein
MNRYLTRNEVRSVFITALNRVANFNESDPELEKNTFVNFHEFHIIVFLNALKGIMNNRTFTYYGKTFCYNITLNENMVSEWNTFKDCIDYIYENQLVMERLDNVNL